MPETVDQHWVLEPTQSRSRETEAAICAAVGRLLAEKDFAEISVADIAAEADVSVGGFYRRFRDKRAVLLATQRGFLADALLEFDARLSTEALEGETLEGIARTYIALMVEKFRQHRRTILQVMKHSDPKDQAELDRGRQAFNEHVHGRFRELLWRRSEEITHPDPELALNLAIFFASSAARDAVWRNSLSSYPVTLDDAQLVDELVRGFVAYLGAEVTP